MSTSFSSLLGQKPRSCPLSPHTTSIYGNPIRSAAKYGQSSTLSYHFHCFHPGLWEEPPDRRLGSLLSPPLPMLSLAASVILLMSSERTRLLKPSLPRTLRVKAKVLSHLHDLHSSCCGYLCESFSSTFPLTCCAPATPASLIFLEHAGAIPLRASGPVVPSIWLFPESATASFLTLMHWLTVKPFLLYFSPPLSLYLTSFVIYVSIVCLHQRL